MATLYDNLTDSIANVRANRSDSSALAGHAKRTLELRLPSTWPDAGELQWCLREADRVSAHGSVQALDELPAEVRNTPIHIWSPAEDTLLTSVALPTRSRGKIIKALPYALEDRLLSDPAELFFTFDRDKSGEQNVSVTSRAKLQQWLSTFDDPTLQLRSMTPETLSVPLLDNAWVLFCEGEDCWLRTGNQSGFRCRIDSGSIPYMILAALRQASHRPGTLVIHNPPDTTDPKAWEQTLGIEILTEQGDFWEVARQDTGNLNLLRDEFAPRSNTTTFSDRFRPAAYLFGLWLAGTVAVTTIEYWQLNREHHRLRAEMTTIFKGSYPQEAAVIVDPYRQMQANLSRDAGSGSRPANGFLASLDTVAPIIKEADNASVTDIEYRDDALLIGLKLPDYRSLENVKSALERNRVGFTVTDTRQSGKNVAVRLKLNERGVQP